LVPDFWALHPLFGLTVGTLLLLLTPTAKAENHWRTYPVKAFGAVGDGLHDDTDAIQEAEYLFKRSAGNI